MSIHTFFKRIKFILLALLFLGINSYLSAQKTTMSMPEFSVERGFFDQPFQLEVTSKSAGATIKYTLDGSDPRVSKTAQFSVPPAQIQVDPLSTTGRGLTPGFVVRAMAIRDGYTSSEVVTHTYLFASKVKTQTYPGHDWPGELVNNHVLDYEMDPEIAVEHAEYSVELDDALLAIPSISIVLDNASLFNTDTGIYVNPMGRGRYWERSTSVELLNPDKSEGFQVDAGLRIRGGYSRQLYNPKHAFRLFFRSEYGYSKLNFPLFENEGVSEFDNIDLRTSQNYSWAYDRSGGAKNTFVRDVYSRDMQREMDQPYTRSRYYHLYVNGLYWGLFQTQERSEASFAESYYGGKKSDYDVIKVNVVNSSYSVEATDGNMEAWNAFYEMAYNGFDTDEAYYKAQGLNTDGTENALYTKYLDVDNLIDYMISTFYTGDGDGPVSSFIGNTRPNNFYAFFNREDPDGFKFLRHDAEHSMGARGGIDYDRTGPFPAGTESIATSNPQYFHQQLVAHPDYVARFADKVNKYFFNKGLLTPDSVLAMLQPRIKTVDGVIVAESARWGDAQRNTPYTKQDWQNEIDWLTGEYVPQRTQIVLGQLKAHGWFPNIDAPTLNTDNNLIIAERISISGTKQIVIKNPNSTGEIYYTSTGTDPRLPGGNIAANAVKVESAEATVEISNTTVLKARIKNGNIWSAVEQLEVVAPTDYSGLIVSELHYNPSDLNTTDGEYLEFIELKNTGTSAIDLALCSFTNGVNFTFNNTAVIEAGEYLVLASNIQQFNARYANVNPAGEYSGRLSNSGEWLTLSSPNGEQILSFKYNDKAPWPEIADGIGFSLVLTDESGNADLSLAENWQASAAVHGTPGAANVASEVLPVLVFEVFSRSDYPNVDAIELYNPNSTELDISNWYLTDNFKRPTKWKIPEGTAIPAKGYVVFNQGHYVGSALEFAANEFGSSFSFSSHGESAYVFSADQAGNLTGYTHGFDFDATDMQLTFGRYITSTNDEHFVLQADKTLGADNSSPYVGSIIINKIMYNPSPEGCEFVELLNIGNDAVNLFDATGVAENWKVKGIGFDFPDNVSMQPGASVYIIESDFSVNEFRSAYFLDDSVQVFCFSGGLKNNNETITLVQPSEPYEKDNVTLVDEYVIDKVSYSSALPWPLADGNGYFLQKDSVNAYGNDPVNWVAATTNMAIAYDGAKATENVLYYSKLKAVSGKAPFSWQVAQGELPLNITLNTTSGEIEGTPATAGATNLTVMVTDSNGTTASLPIIIEVLANNAPIAVTDSVTVPQNRTSVLNILANDTDKDGDKYSWNISVLKQPENGTAVVDTNTMSIVYTPNTNFYGTDEFEYQVSHLDSSSMAKVYLTVEPFNVSDYNALVAIYNALGGDNWTNKTGWDIEINNVSNDWYGVRVRGGRVVGLSFIENNLNGTLPPEIYNLTALEELIVAGNPNLSGELSNQISNLAELQVFDLSFNGNISGQIPSEIGGLEKLRELYLNGNNLSGSIPKELGNLKNLNVFILYANNISGEIPPEIGTLSNLRAFIVGMNNLSGTIPSEFGALKQLIELYIFSTGMGGDIPEELSNLTNLKNLWLADNYFTSLPDFSANEFYNFTGPNDYSGFCVKGNHLRFDDISPNLSVLPTASSYNPQRAIEISPSSVQVNIGGELSLSFEMEGTGNEYQWFNGSAAVSDISSSPDFYLADVTSDDLGKYTCKITNPSVPNLTLITTTVTVTSDGTSVDFANSNGIEIYANYGSIFIKSQNAMDIDGVAEVYDVSGKMVKVKYLNNEPVGKIDVAELSGAFVVKVVTADNIYTEKVVVR